MDKEVVKNTHGVSLPTTAGANLKNPSDIVLIIGGQSTRKLINDEKFLDVLRKLSNKAKWVLSVCTGIVGSI